MVQEPRPPGPRQGVLVSGLAIVIVLLLLAEVASWIYNGSQGYFVISPGTAPLVTADPACRSAGGGSYALPNGDPCVKLVVPSGKAHTVTGSVMMVDVLEGTATWNDYLLHFFHLLHHVDPTIEMVPAGEILGPLPANQLNCQDNQDMTDSTSFAAVVALRHLGYSVTENDLGARVYAVFPGTPAAAAWIRCNDLFTQLDGHPVHTNLDLVNLIHASAPGRTIHLTVRRGTKTVQIAARLESTPAQPPQPALPNRGFLGVSTNTDVTFDFPYRVSIQVGNIGGPSAGLALTLGLLDVLSNGNLTGGHRIAATGTIDLNGDVGPIGDAAQKAVAVRRAGTQIFFVPPANYQAALSQAGSMKVMEVSTLQQALNDLKALGGQIPPTQPSQNRSG